MRIVVAVEHVPDTAQRPRHATGLTIDRVDRVSEGGALNPADARAVEQAVQLARLRLDVQVTVLTMGPPGAAGALLAALALGADDAVHVSDAALHGSDALATSLVLAAAARRIGFDLLLCGAASSDSGMAAIPIMLAERLRVPAILAADRISAREDTVFGCCRGESGDELIDVACELPALVAVTDRGSPPRTPPFPAIAEARAKLVRRWPLSALDVDPARVGVLGAVCQVRAVHDRRATGPIVIEAVADPAAAARTLADFLTLHGLA